MTTATATAPPPAPPGHVIDCRTCEQYGARPWPQGAAEYLVAVHDDLHHQGMPTATLRAA